MTLLLPIALAGLVTVPIILLLHLFRNRRERLPISSLRLWRGLEQKRRGGLPRTIPISLLLLLQLLVAGALTIGLAQPAFSFLREKPRHLIFILDTTTSMLATDTPPASRFEMAREMVQAELEGLSETDSFVIVNLNQTPDILLSGEGGQKNEAVLTLDNFVAGGTGQNLHAAITLANGLLVDDRINQIMVLTDGNYAIQAEDLPQFLAPFEWPTLAAANEGNQALINVSSRVLPDGRHRLFARIVNYAERPVSRTLRVLADDAPFAEQTVELEAQAELAQVWTLPASAQVAAVEIAEADVLLADNRADLPLTTLEQAQILLLTDNPVSEDLALEALHRALQVQPGVVLSVQQNSVVTTADFKAFDLIVFNGLPPDLTRWPTGNILVVNPPLGHPLLPAQNFARDLRPEADTTTFLLRDIDWSGVYFERLAEIELPPWAEVDLFGAASASNGVQAGQATHPVIFHGDVDQSRLVVWNFDLGQSNLSARLALPLLTANTLESLLVSAVPAAVPLGEPIAIGSTLDVVLPGGQRLSTTPQADTRFTRTKQPGLYQLYDSNNNLRGSFAVHAGSALESNLTPQFNSQGITQFDVGAGSVTPETEHTEYWPWLIGLALAAIVVEGGLAWRK